MFGNGCYFLENERVTQKVLLSVMLGLHVRWLGDFARELSGEREVSFNHVSYGKNEQI